MLADSSTRASPNQEFVRPIVNRPSVSSTPRSDLNPSPRSTTVQPTTTATTAPSRFLTSPPRKNTVRFIDNDQNNRREKYDGSRWRVVCIGNNDQCTNVAYTRGLCHKHNAQQRSTEPPQKKRKLLVHQFSVPSTGNQARHIRPNITTNIQYNQPNKARTNASNDDDDIEILEVLSKSPPARRTTCTSIKREYSDFNIFSVDYIDDPPNLRPVKQEPCKSTNPTDDIQYLASKTPTVNGINIAEMIAKKLPPLTDFEEEYLATRMIERLPIATLMIDAQLFLHREAIDVVRKNYRSKMESVAPEYFYDFLLRHPRVALHFQRWFSRCKPSPPNTGCPIDMKVWTLAMIVRGATTIDPMIDECEG